MRVVDADTGQGFSLNFNDQVQHDLRIHETSINCSHTKTAIRKTIINNGGHQFRNQCLVCHDLIGSAVAHSTAPSDVPLANLVNRDDLLAFQKVQYDEIIQKHVRLQKSKKNEFWIKYKDYLGSPQWKSKRNLVLERACKICEGCRQRDAEQVHHLTYSHVFDEFLFELVALCKECHDRAHLTKHPDVQDMADENELPCADCRWYSYKVQRLWCGKFDTPVEQAMDEEGACGPLMLAFEPLN